MLYPDFSSFIGALFFYPAFYRMKNYGRLSYRTFLISLHYRVRTAFSATVLPYLIFPLGVAKIRVSGYNLKPLINQHAYYFFLLGAAFFPFFLAKRPFASLATVILFPVELLCVVFFAFAIFN